MGDRLKDVVVPLCGRRLGSGENSEHTLHVPWIVLGRKAAGPRRRASATFFLLRTLT